MRTVMRSSANKEVDAIVVQTVDRIGPHANDSLVRQCGRNILPPPGVRALASRDPPTASGRVQRQEKRPPAQQPNATGAQPSPARISRAVTAGPVRESQRELITLTSRANALRRQPRFQPSHPHTHTHTNPARRYCLRPLAGDDKGWRIWEAPLRCLTSQLPAWKHVHIHKNGYYAFGRRCDPSHAAQAHRVQGRQAAHVFDIGRDTIWEKTQTHHKGPRQITSHNLYSPKPPCPPLTAVEEKPCQPAPREHKKPGACCCATSRPQIGSRM